MGESITHTGENAKSATGKSFTKNERCFTISSRVVSAINTLWPKKAAQYVSHLTGCDERTVKFWLAGETRMSVESIGALLDTDEGFKILAAIMGDSTRQWWIAAQIAQDIRTSKVAIKREQRRTDALRAQLSMIEDEAAK